MKRSGLYLSVLSLMFFVQGCIPDGGIETLEGSWSCTETSKIYELPLKGTSIYPVYIAQDLVDDNAYYIDNFYQLGEGVEAKITLSGNSINLERQTVDGIVFEGEGTVNTRFDQINLIYTADDGGGEIDQVTAEYSR